MLPAFREIAIALRERPDGDAKDSGSNTKAIDFKSHSRHGMIDDARKICATPVRIGKGARAYVTRVKKKGRPVEMPAGSKASLNFVATFRRNAAVLKAE